ncbi:HAD hydrolase-like protein [Phytomonospora sp. NPDC050363]|uniref:HAD family hydrolase n=1 Tax=Phytomonospora sp. NPDC050363 TaxID=3155642 RepID=UPI0033EEF7E8
MNARDGYLTLAGLREDIAAIVGRPYAAPERMKPDPAPIRAALAVLGEHAREAVMAGDSATDVRAARAAGTAAVGYANRPGKARALTDAGAEAVITHMRELAAQMA